MAKFSKDDYTTMAGAVQAQSDAIKASKEALTDEQIVTLGRLLNLKKTIETVRDTPAKPRGKSAAKPANGAAAPKPATAGAKK